MLQHESKRFHSIIGNIFNDRKDEERMIEEKRKEKSKRKKEIMSAFERIHGK